MGTIDQPKRPTIKRKKKPAQWGLSAAQKRAREKAKLKYREKVEAQRAYTTSVTERTRVVEEHLAAVSDSVKDRELLPMTRQRSNSIALSTIDESTPLEITEEENEEVGEIIGFRRMRDEIMVDYVWKSTQEMASNSLQNMECPLILMKAIDYFQKNVSEKAMKLLLEDKTEVEKSIFWENKFRELECKYQQAVVERQETEKKMEQQRRTIANEGFVKKLQITLQELAEMEQMNASMQVKLEKAD